MRATGEAAPAPAAPGGRGKKPPVSAPRRGEGAPRPAGACAPCRSPPALPVLTQDVPRDGPRHAAELIRMRGVEDLDGPLGDDEQIGGGRMRRKHPFAGSEFDAAQRDALELGDVNAGETRDLKEEIG